jgi:hypothetical protein
MQIGEPDRLWIDVRKSLGERLRNLVGIGPFHQESPPSAAQLNASP